MRRSTLIGTVSFVLSAPQYTYGADGGIESLKCENTDGSARSAVIQPTRVTGTFLGALPITPEQDRRGESDSERQYPLKARANGSFVYDGAQFSAEVAPDGTVRFHDRRARYSASKVTLSFDLFDNFASGFPNGTRHRYEKASFLGATFDRRTAMAAKWYSRQIRAAEQELLRRLDAIWADTRYRRRERRRIICLLWEDLESTAANAPTSAPIIEGWIRKRLPRGSPDAYSNDELDACSRAGVSAPVFRPYGAEKVVNTRITSPVQ